MKSMKPYFGGTGATLDKIKSILGTVNIDGTTYKLDSWFKEIEVFESLKEGDKVWVPYGGTQAYGNFKRVVWDKYNFKNYAICTPETKDWFYYCPYLIVEHNGNQYNVYEYSFYVENKATQRENKLSKIK